MPNWFKCSLVTLSQEQRKHIDRRSMAPNALAAAKSFTLCVKVGSHNRRVGIRPIVRRSLRRNPDSSNATGQRCLRMCRTCLVSMAEPVRTRQGKYFKGNFVATLLGEARVHRKCATATSFPSSSLTLAPLSWKTSNMIQFALAAYLEMVAVIGGDASEIGREP